MRDATFDELRQVLLSSGVARQYVEQMTRELYDHLDDLQREAVRRGCTSGDARRQALQRIGDQRALARRFLDVPEIRSWQIRHPLVAQICYPVTYVLSLPTVPAVTRWVSALMLSATVTAIMLLAMQLSLSL